MPATYCAVTFSFSSWLSCANTCESASCCGTLSGGVSSCSCFSSAQGIAAAMGEERKSKGTLTDDLGALLSSGDASDVIVMAEDVRLPAHRAVLAARSPVFAAMFRHDLQEASDGSVNIADMSQEVLRQLLQFLYTDEAPLLDCVAAGLLVAADKYCVPRLKQQCEQQLIKDLCVENAAEGAILAMVYSCGKLKAEAISFISSFYQEVMATDGWANAMREHTEETVKICRLLGKATDLNVESETATPATAEETKGSLAGDLLALQASGEASDATLVAGGVPLAVHRAVLAARCPALAQQVSGAPEGILQVVGAREPQLRQALLYIYGDQLPEPATLTDGLVVLAANYGLGALKEYCEEQLAGQISVDNAVSLAVVATKHSCSSLETACVDFIREHIFEVMDTEGWATGFLNDVGVMLKITKCVAATKRLTDEEEVGVTQQEVLKEAETWSSFEDRSDDDDVVEFRCTNCGSRFHPLRGCNMCLLDLPRRGW